MTIEKLPLGPEREGWVSKFGISGWDGYLVCSEHDGKPAEIFIYCAKEGSTIRGLLNALAISISIGLRAGVDPRKYIKSLSGTRFEPAGYGTIGKRTGEATSLVDAVCQILVDKYPDLRESGQAG